MEHTGLNDKLITEKIILSYPQYGLKPDTTTPKVLDTPPPTERRTRSAPTWGT